MDTKESGLLLQGALEKKGLIKRLKVTTVIFYKLFSMKLIWMHGLFLFFFSPDEPMTNLQLKVSASLKQALDKLKLSSENEEKKGKDIRKLSRYVILTVRQITFFLVDSF